MPASKEDSELGRGLRGSRTTGVFRAVNFELFAKPVSALETTCYVVCFPPPPPSIFFLSLSFHEQNKSVMVAGAVCISLCAGYIYYLNVKHGFRSQKDSTKHGKQSRRTKWES